jgi:hypothetical protein
MAENEILDIGNRYRWRRTRTALCDRSVVAERLKRHLMLTDIKDDDDQIPKAEKFVLNVLPRQNNFQTFSASPTQSMSANL